MALAKMDGLLLAVAVLLCLSGNGLAFMATPSAGFCARRSIVTSHEMHRFALRGACTAGRSRLGTGFKSLAMGGDTEGFAKWLESNGAKGSCTATPSTGGRGLTASKAIKAGEEVCSIPIKLIMTEKTARQALGSKAADLDAETAIALQLIKEKAEGDKSFYAPWISILPSAEELDVPLMWSDEEKEMLEGSKVGEDVEELKESLSDEFKQLQSAGWDAVMPQGSWSLEAYEWATSIVSSRSFASPKIDGQVMFAPLADFAGHSWTSGGSTEIAYEGMMREPRLKVRAGSVPIAAGGAVTINYGESNSAQLFKRGMADLDVVKGCYDLEFGISPMDRFKDDKEDILDINGFETEQAFTLMADQFSYEEIPQSYWDMVAYLRLVCVKGSDAFLLESVFRNEVWGFMQLPVSKENEQLVLDTLVGYCEGALDGYETSDAEDAKAQSNGALPLRARMAAAAKLGEKKALRQSLQVFLDDLDTIDDKEYYQERRLKDLNLDRPLDESEIVDPDIAIRPENIGDY